MEISFIFINYFNFDVKVYISYDSECIQYAAVIVQGLILLSCVFGLSRPHITTFCVFGESLWITLTLFIINNRHLYQNIRRPSKLDIHICGPRPEPTYYVCFQAQELCKEQSNNLKPLCIFSSIL